VDDFRACADLCERNGFPRQAQVFRWLAEGGCGAHVVVEYDVSTYSTILRLEDQERGEARAVFLDRGQAERSAALRNARKFREHNVARFCFGRQHLGVITDLSPEELARRVGAILGREVDPDVLLDTAPEASFFASATDKQLAEIAGLFTMRFFEVLEAVLPARDSLVGDVPHRETADDDIRGRGQPPRRRPYPEPIHETEDDDIPF
jgi:hypothetical protein